MYYLNERYQYVTSIRVQVDKPIQHESPGNYNQARRGPIQFFKELKECTMIQELNSTLIVHTMIRTMRLRAKPHMIFLV